MQNAGRRVSRETIHINKNPKQAPTVQTVHYCIVLINKKSDNSSTIPLGMIARKEHNDEIHRIEFRKASFVVLNGFYLIGWGENQE